MKDYTGASPEDKIKEILHLSDAKYQFVQKDDAIEITNGENATSVKIEFDLSDYIAESTSILKFDDYIVCGDDYVHVILEDSLNYFGVTPKDPILIKGAYSGLISNKISFALVATNFKFICKDILKSKQDNDPWLNLTQIDDVIQLNDLLDYKFIYLEITTEPGAGPKIAADKKELTRVINSILMELSYKYNIKFSNSYEIFEPSDLMPKFCEKIEWINELDDEPMQYFLAGEMQVYPHLRYLDYYHVIEYYFLETNIIKFSKKINDLLILKLGAANNQSRNEVWELYTELYKLYSKGDKTYEEDQIKAVFVDLLGFELIKSLIDHSGISLKSISRDIFNDSKTKINLNGIANNDKFLMEIKEEDKVTYCNAMAIRIYRIRNFIVHTKRGERTNLFTPSPLYLKELQSDLTLIRLLAYNLILSKRIK